MINTECFSEFNECFIHKEFAIIYDEIKYVCETWQFTMPTSEHSENVNFEAIRNKSYLEDTSILELDIHVDPGRKLIGRFYNGEWMWMHPGRTLLNRIKERASL